ncbi:DUF192 domain-containing protein [bacterium]|nr:DUF192 domain-containing protein [bacterium]
MIFKLFFSLLRNVRWVITLVLIVGSLTLVYLQYQTIKESPLGAFLPMLDIPNIQQLLPSKALDQSNQTPTPTPYPSTVKIAVNTEKGPVVFSSEVVQSDETRALGLMYRTNLPSYAGMYFVFPEDTQGGFWMKNCEIALDILFINNKGIVVDMKENFAPCKSVDPKQENCPVYTPSISYRTVLEINGGSAKQNGITIGQRTLTVE